jgi:hypothetical protein
MSHVEEYLYLMGLIEGKSLGDGRYSVSIDGEKVTFPCENESQFLLLKEKASNLAKGLLSEGKSFTEIEKEFKSQVHCYALDSC